MITNTDKIHIIIDESSAMHLKKERYFLIGGYITDDVNYVRSKCNQIERELRNKNKYINKLVEIKGTNLKPEHLTQYISYIKDNTKSFIPISILIDKNKLRKKEWNENEAFNFFVKWLVNFLLKNKIIDNSKYKNVEIHMDNRPISTKFKNSLATHLNLNFHQYDINFSVKIKDSKQYPEIRCADIICYMLYRIYNHLESRKTELLLNLLVKKEINLIEYQSFFPYEKSKNLTKTLDLFLNHDRIIM